MPLFYVTGLSGTGKSTIMGELVARGFEAHGIDEEGYGDWINRKTDKVDEFPHDDKFLDIHQWYQDHEWVLSDARISELKSKADATEKIIFLCGVAVGDDKVWHYFDKVIGLVIDEATLRERIFQRRDNQFGKSPDEMAEILKWHANYEENYRRIGAAIVDAEQPVDKVVENILTAADILAS